MNYSNNRQENLCQLEIIAFHLQVFDDVMFWHKRVRECFSEFDRNDVILLIRDKSLWVNTHRLIIVNWNNRQTEILMFFFTKLDYMFDNSTMFDRNNFNIS